MTLAHIVRGALFLAGAWAALAVLMAAVPWAPGEIVLQSAKLVLVGVAALALAVCAFGAGGALLGLSGMSVKPAAKPRPYQPQA